jgi:hypothetical protein
MYYHTRAAFGVLLHFVSAERNSQMQLQNENDSIEV